MSVQSKIFAALTVAASLAVPALSHAEAAMGAAGANGVAVGGLASSTGAIASVVVVGAAAASNISKTATGTTGSH